jgi:ribonuclease PH
VREAFEAAILVQLYPNSEIAIYLQIIQFDGGRTAACINAANLAIIDAGIPVRIIGIIAPGYIMGAGAGVAVFFALAHDEMAPLCAL